MTRHLLALATATSLAAAGAPALGQDRPPPPAPPPGWSDPQVQPYPAPPPMPAGPGAPGAPFAHPLPPGVYSGGPVPYRPEDGPYPGGPPAYPGMPIGWHGGSGPAYGGGYWYAYQFNGSTCGCPAAVTWVPAPVQTHYSYSAPVRHVTEVVEEKVVRDRVTERKIVPVPRPTKYVKAAPAKMTKGNLRATK